MGNAKFSLASGKGAGEALREAGFIVQELDPAKKDHLKKLIEEPFDVAFLCLHGKGWRGWRAPGLYWKQSVFPIRDQVCGQAQRR